MKIWKELVILEKITLYNTIIIFCCFQKENYKVLKIHVNNSSFFEISTSLYKAPHLKASKLNMCRGQLLEEIWCVLCEWSPEEIKSLQKISSEPLDLG